MPSQRAAIDPNLFCQNYCMALKIVPNTINANLSLILSKPLHKTLNQFLKKCDAPTLVKLFSNSSDLNLHVIATFRIRHLWQSFIFSTLQ